MYRKIVEELNQWKISKPRKPLIIRGSRQVGKTYILKNWGEEIFPRVHYLNFEKNPDLGKVFSRDLDVKRIISELEFVLRTTIIHERDLLILDEIQECPNALTSLKYFCEDLPEFAVCAAGSLLGVILGSGSFPVGKVNFLYLHPMDFFEFVGAVDNRETLNLLPAPSLEAKVPEVIHAHLWNLLKLYYVTGGMPEVVELFRNNRANLHDAFEKVRNLQQNIITSYEQDFVKHAGKTSAVHIQALFRNIPMQLSVTHDDSTRRFQFKNVMPKKRGFANWEKPLHWLINAGLAIQVKIANAAQLPLEHYYKPNIFKLFGHDIGLLGCMLNLPPQTIFEQDYGIAKGFFAENFVAQELHSSKEDGDLTLYSWNEGTAQIEFIMVRGSDIVPVEVKSGLRTKAKSLQQFCRKYQPNLSIKISANEFSFSREQRLLNLPLYLAAWVTQLSPN